MPGTLPEPFAAWFAAQGWSPRPHQLAMLDAARAGESVLLIAPTGGGKTLAGFLPSLVVLHATPSDRLHTLYISPLKALATDIARNLMRPVEDMGLPHPHRNPHRRHPRQPPCAAEARPAAAAADNARKPGGSAVVGRRSGILRRPGLRGHG
jgi:Lhr-like helicase